MTLTFNPNGSSLLSYDVIAIPSAITSGDGLFMTSSAQDISAYSSSASQSFSMSFDFSTLISGTGLRNAFVYIVTQNGSFASSIWGN